MSALFAPAIALLSRLRAPTRLWLTGLIFTLPIAGALSIYFDRAGAAFNGWGVGLISGFYLAALYLVIAWISQIRSGYGGLEQIVRRLSEGDLEFRNQSGHRGAIWELVYGLNDMSANLARIFGRVRSSAEVIDTAAKEISAGQVNLSQRTEEQASTLEETASGMEELAATVRQNAENCQQASEVAQKASGVAQEGAHTARRAVERMRVIDESSKKVVDIIAVIEGIAFQTNILALNAAVEAARAGEQGRGFAVVASEVRSLAQRSAQAAKEIKALIEASVSNVGEGSKLVGATGEIIDDIVASVQQVSDLIGEVAVASREQSMGVEEVNKAIAQLQSMTQQNAALVEESAAATMAFEEQAAGLTEAVSQFKFARTQTPAARRVPTPSVPAAPARPRAATVPEAVRTRTPKRLPPAGRASGEEDQWREF